MHTEGVMGITRSMLFEGFSHLRTPLLPRSIGQTESGVHVCIFWHLLSESSFPAIFFFPGKDKKGNLHACCTQIKVTRDMCAYVCRTAPVSFPLVERVTLTLGMAPPLGHTGRSHAGRYFSASYKQRQMIDGWMCRGETNGWEQEVGR